MCNKEYNSMNVISFQKKEKRKMFTCQQHIVVSYDKERHRMQMDRVQDS